MKIKHFGAALVALASSLFISCQDDLSSQGSSLVTGEVTITVDSLPTFVPARAVPVDQYDARSVTKLLGRITVPEYGSLSCSFLSQLYPSPVLGINDTVPESYIDSMKMVIRVPRGSLTGDSLAPQQLKVYKLNRQLPSGITNNVNPADYYDANDPDALIGSTAYTLSVLAKGDSAILKDGNVYMRVNIPREKALECVRKYRTDASIFQWPATFAQYFPGIYVEQSFGNGCIGNITDMGFMLYYRVDKKVSSKDSETGETVTTTVAARDSVCLFSSAPEVSSSNVIDLKLSDTIKGLADQGKSVITTPGGYYVDIDFPAQQIIDKYSQNNSMLTVVSSLSMEIPASTIENDFGIGTVPYLLMVKKSEREEFFRNNKIPDQVTSFYAEYDAEKKSYSFMTLRDYIISLINSGKPITPEDVEFSLVPVKIVTESVKQYNNTIAIYVTRCSNYIEKPTMTLLDTDNAVINFTYSKQEIE
ncbi:MAG: DUF4270 domain-containing protein [Muribaculaceae bacterium]|nr:DUF4270 domain-containing protein [Muribaculaceae bacterium]